jgi:hypothetical protein
MGHFAGRLVAITVLIAAVGAAHADQSPAPSAQALSLARTLVTETQAGGAWTMNGIQFPAATIAKDVGAEGREQIKTVMSEAFFPTMFNHFDDLTEIQVKSYATVLSIDDMKAAIEFFGSPAGKDLIRLKSQIMRTNATRTYMLMGTITAELQASIKSTAKAHGWPSN